MLSTNEFVQALADSNLLSAELLARIRKRVAESGGKFDPRSIAKYLIDRGHLTLWQSNQLLAGRRAFFLGRYKLVDRIGKGGMGVVFKAQHAVMDRVVALKVMSRALLDNPQAVARFNREVRTAAALNHPNIIAAYDADAVGNTHFLVMEYVDGRDLNAWLKARGPFPVAAALDCALQTAQGLNYAHRQGMVHRDIKPVNLLVRWNPEIDQPVVKILDLGLARFVSETQEEGGLTRMGQTIGTPDYIAPEAARSFKDADIRADIFSLGCTLFKLLTGRLPFAGDNTMEKLVARTTQDAPLLRKMRADCPSEVEAVVAKMLARDPAQRYQTPSEVIEGLQATLRKLPDAQAAMTFFREPLPVAAPGSAADIQADADTSLADFFRDFSVSPLRDEKPPAPRREPVNDGLELLPIDEDGGKIPSVSEPVIEAAPPPAPKSEKKRPPQFVEPLPEEPAAQSGDEALLDDLMDRPARSGRQSRRLNTGGVPPALAPARRNMWDSPLILGGGGLLLLLVIAMGAFYWAINRRSGDELLTVANDAYKNGSYAQAAREYGRFLEEFPDDKEASRARVFRGLSQMRQAVGQGGDWSAALATTKSAIASISGETRFGDARDELASILTELSEGIAKKASQAKQSQLVTEGRESLALIDKYVPKELRPGQRMQEVANSLELTSREIARSDALAKTVEGMKASADKGETANGYVLRKDLLKIYPDLASDAGLQEAVLAVAAAERGAVKIDSTARPAEAGGGEPATAGGGQAATQGNPAPGMEGRVVVAQADGSAFAIDAAKGALLWQRPLGAIEAARPIPVSNEPGADVLLFDSQSKHLARVAAATGEVRWRQAIPELPAGAPAIAAGSIFLTTRAGQMLRIDAESGATGLTILLPQPANTGPAVSSRGDKLYQIGEHSSLFVLSPQSGECEEVLYLGHEPGTIAVAPLVVGRYLFVAENHLLDNSQLRVLLSNETGGEVQALVKLPLAGHVDAQPQALDRSLFVVTDTGAVFAYGINAPGQDAPLTPQAQAPAIANDHASRLFVARPGRLWVGSNELLRYDVQPAQGRLTRAAERFQGDVFHQPFSATGETLIVARRKSGNGAAMVAALNVQNGAIYWETGLSVNVAARSVPQAEKELASNESERR